MKRIKFLLICCLAMFFAGCANQSSEKGQAIEKKSGSSIEVYCFHNKQRCATCRAIEKVTTDVLQQKYSDELKSGKIKFHSLQIDENESLADKYEVAWSSLIIDKSGKVLNLTDLGFSYARTQPDVFSQKLSEELDKLLK